MSPFDERLVRLVVNIQSRTGKPAKMRSLTVHLNMPRTTVHWHCKKLEDIGVLSRPAGPKSGYAIKAVAV